MKEEFITNVIHQNLFMFPLKADIVDTQSHEGMPSSRKNALKPVAFAVLDGEEVGVLMVTPFLKL